MLTRGIVKTSRCEFPAIQIKWIGTLVKVPWGWDWVRNWDEATYVKAKKSASK